MAATKKPVGKAAKAPAKKIYRTFKEMDAGSWWTEDCKFIIEHPTNGYSPTNSGMWELYTQKSKYNKQYKMWEHDEKSVKYIGAYLTKKDAIAVAVRMQKATKSRA